VPVSWQITNGLVQLESDEAATFEEWREATQRALASSSYRPGMGLVHDQRRVVRVPLAGEIEARAYYAAGQMRAHAVRRWALVVKGDAAFGMGRMGEALANDTVEFRAFMEMAEALTWARGGPVK
jgi:hypothetical protein